MSLNTEFLKGLGLADDVIAKIFAERGREINEANLKSTQLSSQVEALQKQVAELTSAGEKLKVDALDNSNLAQQLEEYKKKVETFESERKAAEEKLKAEEADKALTAEIETLLGDRKFTSDYAKSGLISDIKAAKQATPTADLNLIFESVTKDKEGIFAAPTQKVTIPSAGSGASTGTAEEDAAIREIMGLPPLKA